jgi:hypothetical protein
MLYLSVSRGFGFKIHGVAGKDQLEGPLPAVSKRRPVDMWELEDLYQAAEGTRSCLVHASGSQPRV